MYIVTSTDYFDQTKQNTKRFKNLVDATGYYIGFINELRELMSGEEYGRALKICHFKYGNYVYKLEQEF